MKKSTARKKFQLAAEMMLVSEAFPSHFKPTAYGECKVKGPGGCCLAIAEAFPLEQQENKADSLFEGLFREPAQSGNYWFGTGTLRNKSGQRNRGRSQTSFKKRGSKSEVQTREHRVFALLFAAHVIGTK